MSVAPATAEAAVPTSPLRIGAARALLLAGMLLGGGWVVSAAFQVYLESHHFSPFGDARWYADALWRLLTEQPLYDRRLLEPHIIDLAYRYNLPPPLALVSPLFAMPAGALLWGWCMAASLAIGVAIVFPRLRPAWSIALLVAVAAWWPVHAAVVWANANALVLLLLAVALRFPRHAGWAIGAAASVKFVPVLMVAWLVGRRAWRQAGIAVAVPLALTAVVALIEGPQVVTDFITVRLNESSLLSSEQWGLVPMGFLPVIGYLVAALIALAAAWRASFTLAVVSMLVAVPHLHLHYWIWLLVPLLGATPLSPIGDRRWALSARQLRAASAAVVILIVAATGAWAFASEPARSAAAAETELRLVGAGDGATRYFDLAEGRHRLTLAPATRPQPCYLSAWLRHRDVPAFAEYLGGHLVRVRQGWSRDVSVPSGVYYVDVHSAGCGWTISVAPAG